MELFLQTKTAENIFRFILQGLSLKKSTYNIPTLHREEAFRTFQKIYLSLGSSCASQALLAMLQASIVTQLQKAALEENWKTFKNVLKSVLSKT